MTDLAQLALDVAKHYGASYADVRIVRYLRQNLTSEDERIRAIHDSEDIGIGVRVIVNGAWGFAGTARLTREEVQRVARQACDIAAASATSLREPVRLVPEPPRVASFKTPCAIDPFAVSMEEKVGLLLEINRRLLKHKSSAGVIKKAQGHITLRKDERLYANTEGSLLTSEVVTTGVWYQATAVGMGDAQTRGYHPPPLTRGYENINADDLLNNCDRVAQQALEKLTAKECPVGVRDLILDPHNLALTIHESVGHATELDRALGYEESLAGRSFATPDKLNTLQYGAEIVNFVADNTLDGGLATWGFDDDGVEGQRWFIVEDGIFRGYSTSREVAGEIGLERSTGGCRADHWGSIPIVRIPNLSLAPGKQPLSLDELISDTKDGIYIEGMGSFSIDQMRCNFQFGGDAFWEIKDGRIVGMLKNVIYQSITTDFWNSCDAICDERFWVPNGVLNCGKGDPMQIAQMTHGASPARFRRVKVGGAR
ncbi:MAG: TldD/PmbA family protein [Abditibacteriales bacterium]|nr:TldD/PmbA family protein [Abditibacteriales bacterium]MDW8365699.1 TldD/PmbA family protein [Abditibacteriales bacterium]